MTAAYPKPATPLPWCIVVETRDYHPDIAACHIWTAKGPGNGMVATTAPWSQPYERERKDAAYIVRATNAFPHLVAALERVQACHVLGSYPGTRAVLEHALAIACGAVTP